MLTTLIPYVHARARSPCQPRESTQRGGSWSNGCGSRSRSGQAEAAVAAAERSAETGVALAAELPEALATPVRQAGPTILAARAPSLPVLAAGGLRLQEVRRKVLLALEGLQLVRDNVGVHHGQEAIGKGRKSQDAGVRRLLDVGELTLDLSGVRKDRR